MYYVRMTIVSTVPVYVLQSEQTYFGVLQKGICGNDGTIEIIMI